MFPGAPLALRDPLRAAANASVNVTNAGSYRKRIGVRHTCKPVEVRPACARLVYLRAGPRHHHH